MLNYLVKYAVQIVDVFSHGFFPIFFNITWMIFAASFICFLLPSVYKLGIFNSNFYFVEQMLKIVCDSMLLYIAGFSGKLCKQGVRVVGNLCMHSFFIYREGFMQDIFV